jgi:hypothetical protein
MLTQNFTPVCSDLLRALTQVTQTGDATLTQ